MGTQIVPITPRYRTPVIMGAPAKQAFAYISMVLEDIYKILNNVAPIVPPGTIVGAASEGAGASVYDTTTAGVLIFRSIASAGTYSTAIAITTAVGEVRLTFTPSAVPLSAFAVPGTDVSFGGFKITNLADATAATDAANMETVWRSMSARIAVRM